MSKTTRIIFFAVLIAILLVVPATNASAALTRCRTDPIFTLSNGDMISVTLDISTTSSNVRNITYVLHVPAGVTVKNVAYTAGNLRLPETYQVRQDSPAKTYTIDTVITTQSTERVGVTVFARINTGITKSVSGFTGQHLLLTLIRP